MWQTLAQIKWLPVSPPRQAADRRMDRRTDERSSRLASRQAGRQAGDLSFMPLVTAKMIRAHHAACQPLQNDLSGHLGRWATSPSAEQMLDGQHERIGVPATAGTAHDDLPEKTLDKNRC